jgi:hypothetical protein
MTAQVKDAQDEIEHLAANGFKGRLMIDFDGSGPKSVKVENAPRKLGDKKDKKRHIIR